jgi:membrane protease subunit HflC
MQAYDKSMQRGDTRLVLKPDTDFFRYFSNPSGQPPPGAAANSPASTPSAPPAPGPQ